MAVVVVIPRADLEHYVAQVETVSRKQAGLDRMDHVGIHEDLPRDVAAPVGQVGVLVIAAQGKPMVTVRLPVDDDSTRQPCFLQRGRANRKPVRRPELLRRHRVRIESSALRDIRHGLIQRHTACAGVCA